MGPFTHRFFKTVDKRAVNLCCELSSSRQVTSWSLSRLLVASLGSEPVSWSCGPRGPRSPGLSVFRKNAVELELAKCRMDMMSLNSQLLDAIQQKLNLSQQLEAWQVKSRETRGEGRRGSGGGGGGVFEPKQCLRRVCY